MIDEYPPKWLQPFAMTCYDSFGIRLLTCKEVETQVLEMIKYDEISRKEKRKFQHADHYFVGNGINKNKDSQNKLLTIKKLREYDVKGWINCFFDDNGDISHLCNFRYQCSLCKSFGTGVTVWKETPIINNGIKYIDIQCDKCYSKK